MLEPANGEHTEFTDMVQVVNVKTDPSKEFEITEVTYSHPLGIKLRIILLRGIRNPFVSLPLIPPWLTVGRITPSNPRNWS